VERHETRGGTRPWWDLVNASTPVSAEDVARLAADVDIDDLDNADWFAVAPALCRWPRWQSIDRPSRGEPVRRRSLPLVRTAGGARPGRYPGAHGPVVQVPRPVGTIVETYATLPRIVARAPVPDADASTGGSRPGR
jgi:hypothetical protein